MQIKNLNSYRITFKSGKIERINAESLIQALENTEEKDSPVVQTFMVRENVETVVADEPTLILFTTVIENEVGGSLVSPTSGSIHVGDSVEFNAVPKEGFEFVSWSRNGKEISREAQFLYEMTPLLDGEDTAVFSAKFKAKSVSWQSVVQPAEAAGAGCVAFPLKGEGDSGDEVNLIAVEAGDYKFKQWETREGEALGTNKILSSVIPEFEAGVSVEFVAVFEKETTTPPTEPVEPPTPPTEPVEPPTEPSTDTEEGSE